MVHLVAFARKLRDGEDAATAVEYILMLLFLAMAIFSAVAAFGNSLIAPFQKAANGLH